MQIRNPLLVEMPDGLCVIITEHYLHDHYITFYFFQPGYVQRCNRRVLLNFLNRRVKEDNLIPTLEENPEKRDVQFSNYTQDNLKKRTYVFGKDNGIFYFVYIKRLFEFKIRLFQLNVIFIR